MTALENFLRRFVSDLNSCEIAWCVLRNYAGLPAVSTGDDLDLLVAENDFPRCLEILAQIPDVSITAIVRRAYAARVFLVDADGECAQLDFTFTLSWKGLPYSNAPAVLRRARQYEVWPALRLADPADEAIITLLEHYLWGGIVSTRYEAGLQAAFQRHAREIEARIAPFFGRRVAQQLVAAVAGGRFEKVKESVREVRLALLLRGALRPLSSAYGIFQHYRRELQVRVAPDNLTTIAVLGVDGAGKTTLLNALELRFGRAVGHVHRKRVRPRIFYDRQGGQGAANAHPHQVQPDCWLWSSVKMAVWCLELPIEKYLLPKPTAMLALYDRYFDDVLVDRLRYRYSGPVALLRFLQGLTVAPDLYIVLDAPAQMLYARKSEISLAEVNRQRQAYLDLARSRHNVLVLDTSQPREQVAEQAQQAVLQLLVAKAEKRTGLKFAARTAPKPAVSVTVEPAPRPLTDVISDDLRVQKAG